MAFGAKKAAPFVKGRGRKKSSPKTAKGLPKKAVAKKTVAKKKKKAFPFAKKGK
jgi:hypothetical protein